MEYSLSVMKKNSVVLESKMQHNIQNKMKENVQLLKEVNDLQVNVWKLFIKYIEFVL